MHPLRDVSTFHPVKTRLFQNTDHSLTLKRVSHARSHSLLANLDYSGPMSDVKLMVENHLENIVHRFHADDHLCFSVWFKVKQYVRISDRLQTLSACACREACLLEFLKRNGTLRSIYLTSFAEIEIDAAVTRPFSSDFHHKQEMDHFESADDACSAIRLNGQCHSNES